MEINLEELQTVFNTAFVKEFDGEVTINERQKQATVTEFKFTNAKFLSFDNDLIDKNNQIFEKKEGGTCFSKGCDGVLILKYEDIWHLCLVELKSGFNKIPTALNQIQISYTKFLMLLELMHSIDITNFKTIGLVVAPKKMSIENKTMMAKAGKIDVTSKKASDLYYLNKVDLKRNKSILEKFPIKDKFRFESMPIFHIDPELKEVDILQFLN